jgi:hypothetical protein
VNSHLFNSFELLERLENLSRGQIHSNCIFVSFDVTAMYTNIPVEEAIQSVRRRLMENIYLLGGLHVEDILDLLKFILTNNVFHFNQRIFVQQRGLAMGSRISPILSTLVLDDLEKQTIFSNSILPPLFYARYVDDTLALVNSIDHANNILHHLNSHHPSLKFTMECAHEDGYTPFLDLKLRTNDQNFLYKLYQKATRKNIFVNYHSALPFKQKHNIACNEILRSTKLSSCTNHRIESMNIITTKLIENNYPHQIVNKLKHQIQSRTQQHRGHHRQQQQYFNYIRIPYVSENFNRRIQRIIRSIDASTRIINTNNVSLRSMLNKQEKFHRACNVRNCSINDTNLCFQHHVVYKVTCPCSQFYIGSTTQFLHNRIAQHLRDNNSAIKQHVLLCPIYPQGRLNTTIVSRCNHEIDLRMAEAIAINKTSTSLNRRDELNQFATLLTD